MAERIAKVYPEFLAHIDAIVESSQAASDATCLEGQRRWDYPPTGLGWYGDPYDLANMNGAFDRTPFNTDYVAVISTPGQRVGEAIVIKLQLDYIAMMERAFRTRHASSIRCKLHASSRRGGHANLDGPFKGTMVAYLTGLLGAAFNDPVGEETALGRTKG